MTFFLDQLLNGLSLGSLYALIAVGYTVVYGIVQLINFAHGEIFMIGAFGALSTWTLLGWVTGGSTAWWNLPLMLIGAVVVGVIVVIMAMPCAAVTSILAESYGGNTEFPSKSVFLSSLFCLVTIPLISLLL